VEVLPVTLTLSIIRFIDIILISGYWFCLEQVVGACSAGISELGLRGFGAVGCAEPLLIIVGGAALAGAWTLRVFLESLKGPSKEVLAAKRHLAKQQKQKDKRS
jgi:hypothetical protein